MDVFGNRKQTKMNKAKRDDLIFYWSMLIIPLVSAAIFYVYVNFNSFVLAFSEYKYMGEETGYKVVFAGLDNFKKVIQSLSKDPTFSTSAKNSIVSWAIKLIFTTIPPFFFSYYMYKQRLFSGWFKILLYLPGVISGITISITLKYMVESAYPMFVEKITGEIVDGLLTNPKTAFNTLIFMQIWSGFGGNCLLYLGTMNGIPDTIPEAAALDGITPLKEMILITIPMIWPTVVLFLSTSLIGFFTADVGQYNIYQDGADANLYTFGYYLFVNTKNSAESGYPFLSAMGLIMTILATPIVLGTRYALRKWGPRVD